MNFRGNAWLATTFDSIFGGKPASKARRELGARLRRSARRDTLMAYETLESRVVLWSGGGQFGAGAVIQDLNNLGVLTSPVIAGSMSGATSTNSTVAQLQTDQQALETELQGLSVKSNVDSASLTKLLTDSAALGQDWYGIDPSKLQQALSDLTAAATGSATVSNASAQSEFVGLFPGADATPATSVFNDVTSIVSSSGIAAGDLSSVASDQAAVQKDLTNLSPFGGGGPGFDSALGMGEGQAASALTSALENVGVFTSPITSGTTTPPTSTNTLVAQLQTDQNALQTELQSLATNAGVTVGDLTQLSLDSQALDIAIRGVSSSALQQAVSDVASAATGSTTVTAASASSEFTGLFPSSDQAAATSVYNELVKIVADSGVTGTDLSTVAADEATIQADLTNLQNGNSGSGGFHAGGGGGGGGSSRQLTSILNNIGVMTGPINSTPTNSPTGSNTLVAQLQTDEEGLATELQSLASKSGVTASDLSQLNTDSQALSAGLNGVATTALQKAVSDLAAAATGSTTITSASATTEFAGLFPASDAAAAATVSSDLVKIVTDSGVTSTDLTTVGSDQAAIQTDLNNLHGGNSNTTTLTAGSSAGTGATASTTTLSAGSSGGTGSGGGTSGGGSTGGGSTGGTGKAAHHRKAPPPPRRHRKL
jgi:hypothetical protein